MRRQLLLGWSVATLALTASVAWAWGSSARLNASVWGHQFSEVEVQSSGCVVITKLAYTAPAKAYKSRLEGMNHYRFRARLRFASGKMAVSPGFSSTAPGSSRHDYRFDTKAEGCWGKHKQVLRGVDVTGCRGEKCTIEPFK
jgi:hypothetical protein